jgi:hypothetical protein
MDKTLPVIRINDDVFDLSFAKDIGDSPMVSDSVAPDFTVLCERL